jgi:hypothetical protein
MTGPSSQGGPVDRGARETVGGGVDLDAFLAATGVKVVDVMRGAADGTRRVLLGSPERRTVAYTVAVADDPSRAAGIETEVRVLTELRPRLTPVVLDTLPRVVARVAVGDRPAVVMAAVPGLRPERQSDDRPPDRGYVDAVSGWLDALWRTTVGLPGSIDLGRSAADRLLARYCGSRQLAPALGAVHRARRRLEGFRVRRTAVHGCLCPRHVFVRDGRVTGVDDWGLATPAGEPLRDLGNLAVHLAGSHLPEVLAGRTGPAQVVRDLVGRGLAAAVVPPCHWRDVLVLAQAERAIAAVEQGRVDEIGLLVSAVQALPAESEVAS